MATTMTLPQIFALLALFLLAAGCLLVLQPFATAILWAIILCLASWPLYGWLDRQVGGRRTLSAAVTTAILACLFVVPFVVVGPRLVQEFTTVAGNVLTVLEQGPPGLPEWVGHLPIVGPAVADYWAEAARNGPAFTAELEPYVASARRGLINVGVLLGQGVIQLVFSLIIAFFLYRDGRRLGRWLAAATARFAGERAKGLIDVAEATTRGVVYGILGTALAQGLLAAIGFLLVGVSGALFLGLLTFFLSLIPMGPPLVWLPVGLWLISEDEIGRGIFVLVYGALVISCIDNFLKPYFISREGGLPFLLVFLGVLGGIAAFGFIGIFLGPVLLGLGFSLAKEWSASGPG